MHACALFLFFSLLFGTEAFAQAVPQELVRYADTVLINGKIVTVDERSTIAQAVAVRDGKILAVGKNPQILKLAGPKTVKIDLKGRTVLPGLIDTHSHLQEYALDHWGADHPVLKYTKVGGSTEEEVLAEIKKAVESAVKGLKPGAWVRLNVENSEAGRALLRQGKLTNATIDPLSPHNPVLIKSGTRGLLNSLGIQEYIKEFGGPDPEMDAKTGYLRSTTIVRDMNADLFMKNHLADLAEIYRKELYEWAGYGITTWSSSLSAVNNLNALTLLERRGELPIRLAWGHAHGVSMATGPEHYRRLGNLLNSGSDYLWNNGVGVVSVDGSYPEICTTIQAQERIKSREICRLTPDSGRQNMLYSMVKAGHRISNIHVAGDSSVDRVIDTIERASQEAGFTLDQIRAKRHSIDHCVMNPRPDQYERLKKLNMYASCAPKYIENVAPRILRDYGEEYLKWNVPVKSLTAAGVKTVIELDVHLTPKKNAFYYVQLLTTREAAGRVWNLSEKIDKMTALKMFTRWAAEYVLRENVLGSIEPGKWADLIVLDRDYLTVPENELAKTQVLLTMVGGKIVHEMPAVRGIDKSTLPVKAGKETGAEE
ncbi:MAG TPA: amidohydrolase family protein [Candidatus Acidoferrales bacterium]|nr:amidohydrolase family protein [Candidatus Acidoferrales bacterium]